MPVPRPRTTALRAALTDVPRTPAQIAAGRDDLAARAARRSLRAMLQGAARAVSRDACTSRVLARAAAQVNAAWSAADVAQVVGPLPRAGVEID